MPVEHRGTAIEVEGAKELRRDMNRLKDDVGKKAVKAANKNAAEIVSRQAKVEVPKRSGKLAASIKAQATQKQGVVKAGTAKSVPYAGPIHFGWSTRPDPRKKWRGGPIRPQPFIYEALDRRITEVYDEYERQVHDLTKQYLERR